MDSFVYCWTDHRDKKLYVGLHKGSIDDGYICSSRHMLTAYKERPQDFTREVFTVNTYDVCRAFETSIIRAMFKQGVNCYNLNAAGAVVFTPEIRNKISQTHKHKLISAEHREAISFWSATQRKPATAETREKIRQKKLGVKRAPFSAEWKAKLAAARTGKKYSPEFGQAVSARQLGVKRKPLTEAHKEKLRCIATGKKHSEETLVKLREAKANVSEETKKKISEAKKAYWEKKRGGINAS